MSGQSSNLFGLPFLPYVQDQINLRQQVFGNSVDLNKSKTQKKLGIFPDEYNKLITVRAPWLRLASSVSLEPGDQPDKFPRAAAGNSRINRLKGLGIKNKDLQGSRLAKKFVLQGGALSAYTGEVPSPRKNNTTVPAEGGFTGLNYGVYDPTKAGASDPFKVAYGWGGMNDVGDVAMRGTNRRGFVPMPGITGASIQYYNNGAFAKASVNIVCYSRLQMALIETLYMMPGFSCLLEWGWSHYLDNKTKKVVGFNDFLTQPLSTVLNKYKKPHFEIYKQIHDEREIHSGNYDAMFGTISKFNWKLQKDFSYMCEIQLSGYGDMIESLGINRSLSEPSWFEKKGNAWTNGTDGKDPIAASQNSALETFGQHVKPEERPEGSLLLNATKTELNRLLYTYGLFSQQGGKAPKAGSFLKVGTTSGTQVVNQQNASVKFAKEPDCVIYALPIDNFLDPDDDYKEKKITVKGATMQITNVTYNAHGTNEEKQYTIAPTPAVYMTFGFLLAIIQNNLLKYNKEGDSTVPLFSFDFNFKDLNKDQNYMYYQPGMFSANPKCCIIPYENPPLKTVPASGEGSTAISRRKAASTGVTEGGQDGVGVGTVIAYDPNAPTTPTTPITPVTTMDNQTGFTTNQTSETTNSNIQTDLTGAPINPNLTIQPMVSDNTTVANADFQIKNDLLTSKSSTLSKNFDKTSFMKKVVENAEHAVAQDKVEYLETNLNKELLYKDFAAKFRTDDPYIARVANIYLNMNYLASTLETTKADKDGKISILRYIQQILDDISVSLGSVNNFQIRNDKDTGKIKIYDDIPKRVEKHLNEDLNYTRNPDPLKHTRIEFLVKDGTVGGFVRSLNLSSELNDRMASAITIAAQGNGGLNDTGENVYSFATYSKGMIDRHAKKKEDYVPSTKAPPPVKTMLAYMKKNAVHDKFKKIYAEGLWDESNLQSLTAINKGLQKLIKSTLLEGQQIPVPQLLPFTMQLGCDGIGGIKLFEKFLIDDAVLPPSYGSDNIDMLINGVSHNIDTGGWVTNIDAMMHNKNPLSPIVRPPALMANQAGVTSGGYSGQSGGTKRPKPGKTPPEKAKLRVRLTRLFDDGIQTNGYMEVLSEDSKKVLYRLCTTELPWKGNANGVSCIFLDRYYITPRTTGKHANKAFFVQGAKSNGYAYNQLFYNGYTRNHVLIHKSPIAPGWLLGCIGPGLKFNTSNIKNGNQVKKQLGTGTKYRDPAAAESGKAVKKLLDTLWSTGGFFMDIRNINDVPTGQLKAKGYDRYMHPSVQKLIKKYKLD
jgi:hypothetical protein